MPMNTFMHTSPMKTTGEPVVSVSEVRIKVLMGMRCYPWTRGPVVFNISTSAKENGKNASHTAPFLLINVSAYLESGSQSFRRPCCWHFSSFFDRMGHLHW